MSKYPFTYEDLDEETNETIKKRFHGYKEGLMKVQPGNVILPPAFKKYGERIYNMDVKEDDVWIVTYAKTGTTWTQAAIWSILNNGDYSKLKGKMLLSYWNFIEMPSILQSWMDFESNRSLFARLKMWYLQWMFGDQFENALVAKSPRLIKTHLPFSMLPPNLTKKAKVVYIARNPLDTCVSYFHHHRLMTSQDFQGEFPEFFHYFVKDLVLEAPFWPHVKEAWEKRDEPNVLFMFYEDMKKDFSAAIRKLSGFLGKSLTDEQVEHIRQELSIENMKKNPLLNAEAGKKIGLMNKEGNFVRKGAVGDWKNHFTPEMEKQMKDWMTEGRKGCDLKFPTETET